MFATDIISEKQDMRYLTWSRVRKSSGTAGSYLKAYGTDNGRKIYYKLSCYDSVSGITGHECVNEIIADRLLTLLGIDHLHYQLIHAAVIIDGREHDTWICASEDFKQRQEGKIALDSYYDINRKGSESPLEFCKRMGWEDYIYTMLAVDYLILNRDRHGANIEIIKDASTGIVRPAPLFDHGLSLVFSCKTEDEARKFDPLEDKAVQCFVGGASARKNLELIPQDKRSALRHLNIKDREIIFEGLGQILPEAFLDKIWDMITERLAVYEDLQDS